MSVTPGGPGPLSGRRALVTGGGRGVGAAITLALATAGADVAVSYVRDEEKAAATVAAAVALGVRCRAYRGSVAEPEDNQALVEAVVADFGGLDLLVSNAGIASRGRTVAGTDAAELEKVLRVHALGPHELCRLALPHLRRQAALGHRVHLERRRQPVHAGRCALRDGQGRGGGAGAHDRP